MVGVIEVDILRGLRRIPWAEFWMISTGHGIEVLMCLRDKVVRVQMNPVGVIEVRIIEVCH